MSRRARAGLTMMEAIVVVAIVALLMAILVPTLASAKRSAQIQSSASKLRQLHVALDQYRTEWDGVDGAYESFYALALPDEHAYCTTLLGLKYDFYESPCGFDERLFLTGLNQFPGLITYAPPFFEPAVFQNGANVYFRDYLRTYRENTVMFYDCYCNQAGTSMAAPLTLKRALAITISGQLINRMRRGDGSKLQFYSDPPDY